MQQQQNQWLTDVGVKRNQYRYPEDEFRDHRLDDPSLNLRGGRCGRSLIEVPKPQLEHQEFPEVVIVVAATTVVLVQQVPDEFGRHDAAIKERRAGQVVPQELAQTSRETNGPAARRTPAWAAEAIRAANGRPWR